MDLKTIQEQVVADAAIERKNEEAIESGIENAQVIQATPSGYGDRMDRDRATDKGTARAGVTVKALRDANKANKKASTTPLTGFAKGAAIQIMSGHGEALEQAGANEQTLQDSGIDIIQKIKENTYTAATKQATKNASTLPLDDNMEVVKTIAQQQAEDETYKQGVGFGDMVKGAFETQTVIPQLLNMMGKETPQADPAYDYNSRRDALEQGLSEPDRQFLRESNSLADEAQRMKVIKDNAEANRKLGAHGMGWAFAASGAAGLMDPVGWGLGLGVGKAAQVAGFGARSALEAGKIAKGVSLGIAEGAVGNVAITAALDAAGGHVTDRDYAFAAGFGMVFGGAGAAFGIKSGMDAQVNKSVDEAVGDISRAMDEQFMDGHVQLMQARERAMAKVVDDAPSEAIVTQVEAEVAAQEPRLAPLEQNDYSGTKYRPGNRVEGSPTGMRDMLTHLESNDDPLVASMAARLKSLMGADDIPVYVGDKVYKKGRTNDHYDAGEQKINLSDQLWEGGDQWVGLHEAAHAMSFDRLRYGRANPDSAIGALTKEIDALFDVASAKAKATGFKNYHMQNVDEFVSGLYSGKKGAGDFHEFLSGIPVSKEGKSMLNALVTTVRRILGLGANENNAFLKAVGLSDELFQQPIRIKTSVTRKHRGGYKTEHYERDMALEVDAVGKRIQDNAVADSHADITKVAQRVGSEPTPAAVQKELDNLMKERYTAAMNIVHSRVANDQRFMPTAEGIAPDADGRVLPPADYLMPKSTREAVGNEWGIDETLVVNPADVQILQEIAARSVAWSNANPVDVARIDSVLGKMPWLASTGLQLAKSEHPTARMIAGVLLENTTGAFGRGRTAALDKNLLQRQYDEYLHKAEQHYVAYRGRNNGNLFKDQLSGELRDRFQREVDAEIRSRQEGAAPRESDPDVRGYVDQLEAGYERQRIDQQTRDTVGAARLGDSSRGYAPRRFSVKWARSATPEHRRALAREFADQLDEQWGDRKFAERVAIGYIERARMEAGGGVSVPANIYSDEASNIIRDVMRAGDVPDDQIEKLMGKFSRGGARHTKSRLDLDLDREIQTEAGDSFRISDAFEHDHAVLYQNYSRRVSGDVALANFGIYGQHSMTMLRRTLADFGPNGKPATLDEIKAFDQIAAEFYGRPLPGTGNKALGNIRLLGSMSMLGGMAFNQLAEFSNAIPLLGFAGALKHVSQLPRLIQDVRLNRKSELLDSIELVGGPIGHDTRVIFPHQEMDDTQVWGAGDLNAFDRILRGGSQAMPWLSGFHYVHSAQVRGISEQIVMKSMKYFRDGQENAALLSMGINTNLRTRIQRELPNIATFDEAGNVTSLDITKAKDVDAMSEYVQAVHRGSKQIIQGTYIGETGKWAHDDLLRIMTQFRTFSITSMEKQWSRQRVDQGTIKAFGLLLGSMSIAAPIALARVHLNAMGREDSEEYLDKQLAPAMFARSLLNYTTLSGAAGDIIDAGAALTGNTLSGGRSGQQGSALEAIPALGYASGVIGAIKERDPRELLRALPGQNLPFMVPLLNTLDD
jgi:hypothetical protein